MSKKKPLILVVLLILFPISLFIFILKIRPPDTFNTHLISHHLQFEYPENAEEQFKKTLLKNSLEDTFKKEPINTLYPDQPWSGRIRFNNVSYQCIIAVPNATWTFTCPNKKHLGLKFSILNPEKSHLTFRVFIQLDREKHEIYNQVFDKQAFIFKKIKFEKSFEKPAKIIFETKGEGIGAWINPHIIIDTQNRKPQVFMIILLDTLRADHTSLLGYERRTTPYLDKMSKESVIYENAFSTTSWTLPAHVSLFSGKNIEEHGVLDPESQIPLQNRMLAEIFQQNGYLTAAFTGGGFIEDSYGFHRGFQVYSNEPGSHFSMNSAERVFKHFKHYVERFSESNLFIFLHTYQMHAPYKAPPAETRIFNRKLSINLKGISNYLDTKTECFKDIGDRIRQNIVDLYDASIRYADRALVGNIINYLRERKLFDKAMIVVLSDHGEEFYDHGSWEHGHSLYTELMRIPLVIKYPECRKKGRNRSLTSITDVASIILRESLLSYDEKQFKDLSGQGNRILTFSLPVSPIIKNIPAKVSFLDTQYHYIYNFIDKEKLRFFQPPPKQTVHGELYNHMQDTEEKKNIYLQHPAIVNAFRKLMKEHLSGLKKIRRINRTIDHRLYIKLKSLGYLAD